MQKKKLFKKANQAWKSGKITKSFKLYKKCAKMGYEPCFFNLGYMYDDGIGTKINKVKALF